VCAFWHSVTVLVPSCRHVSPVRYEPHLHPRNRTWRPIGLEMLRIPQCLDNRLWHNGEVSLTCRPRFRSGRIPRTHFCILLSQTRDAPSLEGQVPRGRMAQLHPQELRSLSIASYDSQGYGGGTPHAPRGDTCPALTCFRTSQEAPHLHVIDQPVQVVQRVKLDVSGL
jgi:hypothetical protein